VSLGEVLTLDSRATRACLEDMMPIRLGFVDDQPSILQDLAHLLRQESDIKVLTCYRYGEEALLAARSSSWISWSAVT
jgi:hypothetical protein